MTLWSRRQLLGQLMLGAGLAVPGLTSLAQSGFWALARVPGAIFLMRHAQTEPGIGDPPEFTLGNCQTQRNLDARGKAQARLIGQTFANEHVMPAHVLSSAWCRCLDTARIAFGQVEVMPALNSFFSGPDTASEQSRQVIDYLRRAPQGVTQMLVTHQVNISALTQEASSMGEILLVQRPVPAGLAPTHLRVLGRWLA
jgi:phosphohistidine phosphatase SixA